MSAIGRSATPLSAAARATAGAIIIISRGSKGLGIRYSGPNASASPAYAAATTSLCSARASSAIACTAAISISTVILIPPPPGLPGRHGLALLGLGQFGNRVHGGDFHLRRDGGRAAVQRPTEDVRKA